MTSQVSIFDLPEGRRRRDAALSRVYADPGWTRAADWAIGCVAATDALFTTDDVWQLLHDMAIPAPDEPRAIGGAMRRASGRGVIVPTNSIRQSQRPECHARPVRVWASVALAQEARNV